MAFTIKPFKELVAMTKEKFEEAMIPLHVRKARAASEGEIVKHEEQLLKLETQINEECAKKELNFTKIADLMDDYDLTERRLKQVKELVSALFPEKV